MFTIAVFAVVLGVACLCWAAEAFDNPPTPAIDSAVPRLVCGGFLIAIGIVAGLVGLVCRWVGA